ERRKTLTAAKGADVAITILSPGIQDATISIELRLMELARDIARHPGVRVFVRRKPVDPPAKYRNFYAEQIAGNDRIILTDHSHALMDFHPLTDLFITSISSSSVDLCGAGAQ